MKIIVDGVRSKSWFVFVGLGLAVTSATGVDMISLDTDLGTRVGVMTNWKWWAGYGNAGLLQLGSPTYNWGEPQFGYGDAGFNWSDGPAVFISNGTENFTHEWSSGDAVIQNTGVVKLLAEVPDGLLASMDLTLWPGLPEPSSTSGGWLTIQRDYYGPDLYSGPIELEGGPFQLTGFQLDSPTLVITISGNPAMPYMGISLEIGVLSGSDPSVPEPTTTAAGVGVVLLSWGVWRRRRCEMQAASCIPARD